MGTVIFGKAIVIPEEDAIFVDNGNIEVLGTRPYYVSENGLIEEHIKYKLKSL